MRTKLAFLLFLLVMLVGCVSMGTGITRDEVSQRVVRRWHDEGSYYALLEIVDAHIATGRTTKEHVRERLGQAADSPDGYPNAGPKMWVYSSSRRVPYGSYLVVRFDDRDVVEDVSWVSE